MRPATNSLEKLVKRGHRTERAWAALVAVIALVCLAPAVVIGWSLLNPTAEVWSHLWSTVLPGMLWSTVALLVLVFVGTAILGGGMAWLVSGYNFPGRKAFTWMLVLPLAIPGYILGFVFMSVFGFTGPIQGTLRDLFGPDVPVPEVRSLWGAALVLSLSLFPYVYLLGRAAIREQATTGYEVARSLGYGHLAAARKVVLPMARPSLVAGLTLVMLETLTDFATVIYFNVQTVSVGVYRVWKGMFDRQAASELASLVLLFALAVLALERLMRGRARYEQHTGSRRVLPTKALYGARAWAATATCCAVLTVAFFAPVAQLLYWAAIRGGFESDYFSYLSNSVTLALLAATLVALASIGVSNARRFSPSRPVRVMSQLTVVGYALPGPVIAIGVLLVLAALDGLLSSLGIEVPGLLITGSLVGVAYAYAVRFMALGVNGIDASLQKVPMELTLSARSLGAKPLRVMRKIHLPMTKTGIAVALLLVGIDALKELPMVLLLRPFGFDTLPVWIWQLASQSRWEDAALGSVTIIAASLVPVALLTRSLSAGDRPEDLPTSPAAVTLEHVNT
ncbi:MAG: iron ABC transporter permease [Actinobacteria bacterium]|nr:iron ABC transporter permease [Actinomycetota bacterium]